MAAEENDKYPEDVSVDFTKLEVSGEGASSSRRKSGTW